MTAPRPIYPDQYSFVSRRCTQRQFLLRPDETTAMIFMYCLAEAAERFGIGVVGVLVMSNHYHAVFHDPHACLPAFLAHFHKMVAKVMNRRWNRQENFWASEQTSIVRCEHPEDQLNKLIYTLTNPVKDHLVAKATDWPGASSLGAQLAE